MTDEEFVLQFYPSAFKEYYEYKEWKGHIICQSPARRLVCQSPARRLVVDHYFRTYNTPEEAWRAASNYIKENMLEKLEM